ncbi:TerD family protein [Actinomadura sp. J1-007]|uniref:TerD family protein n=1 Tax=Actinomadura sp. J1-007 TaxID=2661913 RepID=UPI0019D5EDFA|nr:TerD family protein [Actinomadura sp. J1-007]
MNLSASVTDVLVLAEGEEDRRMPRIRKLLIPLHHTDWLDAGAPTETFNASMDGNPSVLARGAVIDLPSTRTARWTVSASWAQRTACEVDVVAFALDEDGQVSCDEDFVFYGAPDSPDGAVHLSTDGPSEQSVTVDLSALPAAVRKVTVAAAVGGTARFGDLGGVEITAAPDGSGSPLAQAALDAATTERTLLLCEIYRRGPVWRLRAVGQGYDHGLAGLARSYGVDIED